MSEKASLKFEHSINVFGNINERKWGDSMTNKTEIFASFNDFLNRADKKTNGVSSEFAERNPNYARDNETNIGCWNCVSCKWCKSCKWCESCESCISCKSCESCESCISCVSCKWCKSCESCESCRSCVSCKSCESCVACVSCESCESCESFSYELKNQSELNVPLVQNIHQSVFNAASAENALDMNNWHVCETTHCRAGWVVHLAGEAGYELERLTSTSFAAMAIYNKSSDIKVPLHMFYVDNDESLTDMKRCAELELDFSRPT